MGCSKQRKDWVCLSVRRTLTALASVIIAGCVLLPAQEKTDTAAPQVAKAVGTIKTIQPDSITITAESGGEVTAKFSASTKILRVPPGETTLKNATALRAQDLQTGDRVLVRGPAANGDVHTITALAVIVMKQSDVAAKQEHDREDWQKRGVGGLVTKVDPAAGAITISSGGLGTAQSITVKLAKNTILRRYAPDSVKFDDAKPAPLDQIKVGDQLRARGTRSTDGAELNADEIVTGAFRNIAGTIKSIDAANQTITIQDAISKGPLVVKVSSDSQMKKLPPEMAQRIAMRLRGTAGGASGDQQPGNGGAASGSPVAGAARPAPDSQAARGAGGGGPPDLQRLLTRLPNSALSDLQKGDAVMIVSTAGGESSPATVITMLAGVDAILTAAPNRTASSLLSPWSLGASAGEVDAAP